MATHTLTGDNGDNNISNINVATNDDHTIVRALGGNDRVDIFFGTFEVYAGEGDDWVQTGGIGGVAYGELGNDVLASPNGGFQVYELHGGEGDDVLFAGRSTTRSYGGLGNDRFSAQAGFNEVLDGGEGFDYVRDLANNSALSGDTIVSIEGQQGSRDNDLLTAWGANSFAGWNNIIMGALGSDVVEGGGSSDLLIGNSFFEFWNKLLVWGTNPFDSPDDDDNAPDTLNGGNGGDTLIGGGGPDELNGGAGLDTASYIESATAVSANLATGINGHNDVYDSIEGLIGSNLSFDGDVLIGNGLDNVLDGLGGNDSLDGSGGNDTLWGRDGNDTLIDHAGVNRLYGGAGDDRYVVSGQATITENAGEGTDTLAFRGSILRLMNNVENLELIGANATALDGVGNRLDNLITGHGGANRLDGREGRDTLEGGAGADTLTDSIAAPFGDVLRGGIGSDTYVITTTTTVEEASGPGTGVDTVQVNGSYTLTANVEKLELRGTLGHSGTGNGLGNTITGKGGANALSGLDGLDLLVGGVGNDTLDGGAGVDRLDGGAGNESLTGGTEGDAFVFAGAWHSDTIGDWQDTAGVEVGQDRLDRIDLTGLTGPNDVDALNDLLIRQSGANVTVALDLDQNRVADTRDLDGNGTLDSARIVVLNATATNFGAAGFFL